MFLRPARIVAASMVALVVIWVQGVPATEIVRFAELRKGTHFHGISVDSRDGSRVYLATHHGLFVVSPGGHATRVSRDSNDYMGFTPHPEDAELLYASGHPAGGGNTGFIASSDGGMTWRQLSKGARGPVDFHHMDVSKADPRVLYGTFRGARSPETEERTGALWRPRTLSTSQHRPLTSIVSTPPLQAACCLPSMAATLGRRHILVKQRRQWFKRDTNGMCTRLSSKGLIGIEPELGSAQQRFR